MGMSAGYIAKKLVIGKSENVIQNMAGNVVEMVVSRNVMRHAAEIRSVGLFLLKSIFSSSKAQSNQE